MLYIPEIVLQEFVKEKFQIFQKHFEKKILYVRNNTPRDKYPDLYFVLEDKTEIPVEVEWKTSNFDHNPDILIEQNGFIFTAIIEPDVRIGAIKQIKIPLDKFEKWYEANAKKLVKETTEDLKKIEVELGENNYVRHTLEFIKNSKRGLVGK